MEGPVTLKQDYHYYLRKASELPLQMKQCGVFEIKVSTIHGCNLKFSYHGTVCVDRSKPIDLTSVDSIISACFNYKPKNLKQITPEHMRILNDAISKAQESLDDFALYK